MKQIDAGMLIERLHNTAFKDGDDRSIILNVIDSLPMVGYEEFEYNKMLEEINYWRNKCERYESTIINMAVRMMGEKR